MRLAKVIGNVVSTIKHEKLQGIKLMVIKPINPDGIGNARPIIVADYLNSAIGNIVYWIEDGTTICKILGVRSIPLRGCIVGIVDKVDFKNTGEYLQG